MPRFESLLVVSQPSSYQVGV